MENQQNDQANTNEKSSFFEKNRILLKGLLIGGLILTMLIPVSMLDGLVRERAQRQNNVTEEISTKWASGQTIVGPIIVIPYLFSADKSKSPVRRYAYLLPEQLNINGKMLPEVRHRSLYDVTLYRSNFTLSGTFDPSYLNKLGIPAESILWNECELMLGVDDVKGLEENVSVQWDSTTTIMDAGLVENSFIANGLSTKVPFDAQKKTPFSISVKLKGSAYLYFAPVGKTTDITLTSPWKNPAFDGAYLPSQSVKTTDGGFTALWKILQVSRNYPQAWEDTEQYQINKSFFGVKLLQPTDGYSETDRSVKYAILVISLTFAISFFAEIFKKRQIHPLQYVLVGLALCIFYTLLLSISEYTGFNIAYMIAATATITLISMYVLGIFKKAQIAGGFALALGTLYAYIFMLIQLQDYALLFGSIGLFVIMAVIMAFSRKIDWYHTASNNINEQQ
jgi:inner membrane protein